MTMIGFRAQNHRQQVAARGADDDTDDRRTRPEIFDPLHREFQFTVDVAANAENHKLPRYYTLADNGLSKCWGGESVWCNPPYSDIKPWVCKALFETKFGSCQRVVMLLPNNRCEQVWWQDYIERARDRGLGVTTRFLRGRPRFDWSKNRPRPEKGDRPPFGLVVIIFTP